MSEHVLKAGTRMFLGAPAKPMPEAMADAIRQVVAQVPGIVEAHLPQCFIEGDTEARQILVIGVQRRGDIRQAVNALMEKLEGVIPAGQFIDILPYASSAVPPEVRWADCQIFSAKKKAWWKIW